MRLRIFYAAGNAFALLLAISSAPAGAATSERYEAAALQQHGRPASVLVAKNTGGSKPPGSGNVGAFTAPRTPPNDSRKQQPHSHSPGSSNPSGKKPPK